MKQRFVFNDQLILDEFCNLKCKYCGGFFPSEFELRHDSTGKIFMPESWKKEISGNDYLSSRISSRPVVGDFFDLANDVLSEIDSIADFKILKISGGEIFLYKDIVNFVKKIHKNYTAIQLLTNGLALSSDKIRELGKLGNVYFQISLDGVTAVTNYARSNEEQILKKILKSIELILAQGMGLEINCVLTKYNTGQFEEMLKCFNDSSSNLVIVPRPVRGQPKDSLNFDKQQVIDFEKIVIEKYDHYSKILPAKQYMERLVFLMKNGVRNWNCYVPFYVLGVNNYGDVSTCTCAGDLPKIGSIFSGKKKICDNIGSLKNYNPSIRYKPCSYCITQYEMFNLYTDGLISEADMLKIPSFRIQGVMDRVNLIKESLVN